MGYAILQLEAINISILIEIIHRFPSLSTILQNWSYESKKISAMWMFRKQNTIWKNHIANMCVGEHSKDKGLKFPHTFKWQGHLLACYLFIKSTWLLFEIIDKKDREGQLRFTINPRGNRRVGSVMVTDLIFANDVTIVSDTACQARELLE